MKQANTASQARSKPSHNYYSVVNSQSRNSYLNASKYTSGFFCRLFSCCFRDQDEALASQKMRASLEDAFRLYPNAPARNEQRPLFSVSEDGDDIGLGL